MKLTSYIEKYLYDKRPQFSWNIKYDKVKRVYELSLGLMEEDDNYPRLEDINGTISDGTYVYFEDKICFYDENISYTDPVHYLKGVKIDFEEGIEKGHVTEVLNEFIRIGTQGKVQLYEFLRQSQENIFTLSWNQKRFHVALETAKDINRYDQEHLVCKEVWEKN